MSKSLKIVKCATAPFEGQKPGTSGLRKKVKVFKQENYTENFVQCILSAMGDKLKGSYLAVGGDGRYYVKEAVQKIIQICAANKVSLFFFMCVCNSVIINLSHRSQNL